LVRVSHHRNRADARRETGSGPSARRRSRRRQRRKRFLRGTPYRHEPRNRNRRARPSRLRHQLRRLPRSRRQRRDRSQPQGQRVAARKPAGGYSQRHPKRSSRQRNARLETDVGRHRHRRTHRFYYQPEPGRLRESRTGGGQCGGPGRDRNLITVAAPTLDSVTTIRKDGSRPFLHPADVRGRFTSWRKLSFALLIVVYIALPWIQINGAPAVFLNLAERQFHLFGFTLGTQDIWLAFFLITGLGFGLFYITALFGRVWCGWACPQTVWLEGVYRRIERWIDGDPNKRRKLDA